MYCLRLGIQFKILCVLSWIMCSAWDTVCCLGLGLLSWIICIVLGCAYHPGFYVSWIKHIVLDDAYCSLLLGVFILLIGPVFSQRWSCPADLQDQPSGPTKPWPKAGRFRSPSVQFSDWTSHRLGHCAGGVWAESDIYSAGQGKGGVM